jgi:flagellar protein FliJ
MVNYQFPLQKVMELKEKQVDELKIKHTEYIASLQTIEQQHTELLMKKKQWEDKSSLAENEMMHVGNLLEIDSYLRYLTAQILDKEKELGLAHEQVQVSRHHLTEKMKEFQAWEKWKQKSREAHQEKLNQIEQKELDEMALQIYVRGLRGNG